jgi:hypothetical protein
MARGDPVLISPQPGLDESVESFTYTVAAQGLNPRRLATGEQNVGVKLLDFPPFTDPRIAEPAVIGVVPFNHQIVVSKSYTIASHKPWYYGTGTDSSDQPIMGWFQRE